MTLTLVIATLIIVALAAQAHAGRRSDTARNLNHGLAGTPMAHTGYALEAAGWKYHINPALIAAIAGTESSFGEAACPGTLNYWGLASCGSSWNVPRFATLAQAYLFMGRFLTSRWPNARTPWDYVGYAAYVGPPSCSSCWGSKVAGFMRTRFGAGPSTTYP